MSYVCTSKYLHLVCRLVLSSLVSVLLFVTFSNRSGVKDYIYTDNVWIIFTWTMSGLYLHEYLPSFTYVCTCVRSYQFSGNACSTTRCDRRMEYYDEHTYSGANPATSEFTTLQRQRCSRLLCFSKQKKMF
jgi:hypothetical protein